MTVLAVASGAPVILKISCCPNALVWVSVQSCVQKYPLPMRWTKMLDAMKAHLESNPAHLSVVGTCRRVAMVSRSI